LLPVVGLESLITIDACLQGFEGFLSSKEALRKRQARAWKQEDRLFSLSSRTSPVVSAAFAQQQLVAARR